MSDAIYRKTRNADTGHYLTPVSDTQRRRVIERLRARTVWLTGQETCLLMTMTAHPEWALWRSITRIRTRGNTREACTYVAVPADYPHFRRVAKKPAPVS